MRSPGAKYIHYVPDTQVMHAIVGLDYDGALSRQIVEKIISPALYERKYFPRIWQSLHPSNMPRVAALLTKKMISTRDIREFSIDGSDISYFAPFLSKKDVSAIGERAIDYLVLNAAVESKAAVVRVIEDISPCIEAEDALVWGNALADRTAGSADSVELTALINTLYHFLPLVTEKTAHSWGNVITHKLETTSKPDMLASLQYDAANVARRFAAAYNKKIGGMIIEQLELGSELGRASNQLNAWARQNQNLDASQVTQAGDLLFARHLERHFFDLDSEVFRSLGCSASDSALESWATQILQTIRSGKSSERQARLEGILYFLLSESPHIASDLRADTMLERIRLDAKLLRDTDYMDSYVHLLYSVAPHMSQEAKNSLMLHTIEMMGTTEDVRVLHRLAVSLQFLCTKKPTLELVPLANMFLASAEAVQTNDFGKYISILNLITTLIPFLPPMELGHLGDAILDCELSEVMHCNDQVGQGRTWDSTNDIRTGDILRRLNCNLSGSHSSAWGMEVVNYMEHLGGGGQFGVYWFLAELAPCASEADVAFWGQKLINDILLSSKYELIARCACLVDLATCVPSLDVRPAIEHFKFVSQRTREPEWPYLHSTTLEELLELPQVPADFRNSFWKDIPLPAVSRLEEPFVDRYVSLWLYTRPLISSDAEKALQAQQCLDMLASPFIVDRSRDALIRHLEGIARKEFISNYVRERWRGIPESIKDPHPRDLWKVLDWAASAEGQALGLNIHRQPILSLNDAKSSAN